MNLPVGRRAPKHPIASFLIAATIVGLALIVVYLLDAQITDYLRRLIGPRMTEHASPEAVLRVIKLILWIGLTIVLVRGVGKFVFGFVFRWRRGYEAPNLVQNIFSITAYIVLFAYITKEIYPGIDLGALFTTSALFGVIIGLALQDTLGNLFSGISLHADRPFQVGDVVVVGKHTGVVQEITWRAVKIRTFQNHLVLISNSTVAKEAIEVCPRDNLNARIVFFDTLYSDSPAKTIHVVREAVREADNVSQKITPIVRIRNIGESGIEWEIKYWLDDYAKHNDTDALVRQLIWYAFRRAGLSFPYPTRTLHVDRRTKASGVRTDSSEFIERLSAVDIFAPLSAEELEKLAAAAESHVFAPGESIIRAGEDGSSMFIVHNGRVQVQTNEGGKMRAVAVLKEGDFFGEMALFTGEPRAANVVTIEETEVLEIGHAAMKHLFETNPDLVESLSHIIAERRVGLSSGREEEAAEKESSAGMLAAIKRFFGLR